MDKVPTLTIPAHEKYLEIHFFWNENIKDWCIPATIALSTVFVKYAKIRHCSIYKQNSTSKDEFSNNYIRTQTAYIDMFKHISVYNHKAKTVILTLSALLAILKELKGNERYSAMWEKGCPTVKELESYMALLENNKKKKLDIRLYEKVFDSEPTPERVEEVAVRRFMASDTFKELVNEKVSVETLVLLEQAQATIAEKIAHYEKEYINDPAIREEAVKRLCAHDDIREEAIQRLKKDPDVIVDARFIASIEPAPKRPKPDPVPLPDYDSFIRNQFKRIK